MIERICSEHGWQSFLERFFTSVEHLVGGSNVYVGGGAAHSILQQEVERLRLEVQGLRDKVRRHVFFDDISLLYNPSSAFTESVCRRYPR